MAARDKEDVSMPYATLKDAKRSLAEFLHSKVIAVLLKAKDSNGGMYKYGVEALFFASVWFWTITLVLPRLRMPIREVQ